jgi:hypothetical protein
MLSSMSETPVVVPAEPVREEKRSVPLELPPSSLTLRPLEAWTDSPIGPAVIIAAAFSVATIFGRTVIGGQELGPVWFDILNGVIFAYIPAATVILRRGVARDLAEIRPLLRCSDVEFEGILKRATCIPAGRLATYLGISVPLFALMPFYDSGFFGSASHSLGDPLLQFFVLRQAILGWVAGYAVASALCATSAYRSLGQDCVKVDLLDTGSLHPLARQGMRSAFTWILLVSLVSLFWLGPGAGHTNGPIIIAVTLWVTASLFYSISGVHDSIRLEKSAQLGALRERIRSEYSAAIEEARSEPDAGSQLAGLIAYYDLIERAPEWPFDAPMVVRLALFATLGLGSWLGGAVVERLFESWF